MERLPPLLVLFDGHCNLCSATVRFIVKRDRRHRFRFAPLTGPTAQRALSTIRGRDLPDSILFFENGVMHERSAAALSISRYMDGAWPIFYAFMIFPRPIRDAVYELVARKRYQWFGRKETCWLPQPGWNEWFPDMQMKEEGETTPASS